MQVAAQVGPVSEITAITAHNDNLLEFTLKDGTNAVKRWQDRSRAESWTAEMRRAAGEKTRERKHLLEFRKYQAVLQWKQPLFHYHR